MSNRLAAEKSPYLLQHKDNPVDWWPWCAAAFERARQSDRPVLLSIGYATCHWCHVMERESFEDAEVAALMNNTFVNIKVDREERPDIDAIYMTVCQLLTRHGGWPLTLLMTPDREPFFAATYIPKDSRQGRMGMMQLIPHVERLWRQVRPRLLQDAALIKEALTQAMAAQRRQGELSTELLDRAYRHLRQRHDAEYGGFADAPKFPPVSALRLLMLHWLRTQDPEALAMVERTLRCMRRGGIYDQVGYGFHRYSTDRTWTLPHFEKMLYDQAMLTLAYTEAFQITGQSEYRRTAQEIITYVLRDLTHPEGAFCTAEDADSEGREGKFYLWHESELQAVLGNQLFTLVRQVYNTEPAGNFLDEATRRKTGENILYRFRSDAMLSIEQAGQLTRARQLLLAARTRRIRPLRDDKVLADWNGLMIAALAYAGRVLDDEASLDAARRAASFIRNNMQTDAGALWHRWRDQEAAIAGMLDDYAFFIWGLLELYQATFEVDYLSWAFRLADICREQFTADQPGLYYLSPSDGEPLLVRPGQAHDNALPSGTAVMMMNILRLARLRSDTDMERAARAIAQQVGGSMRDSPGACLAMLSAVNLALQPAAEVVITGDPERKDTRDMLRSVQRAYAPHAVLIFRPDGGTDTQVTRVLPKTAQFNSNDGAPLAYVCKDFSCQAPTSDVGEVLARLKVANESPPA